jgi:hypothetical protein
MVNSSGLKFCWDKDPNKEHLQLLLPTFLLYLDVQIVTYRFRFCKYCSFVDALNCMSMPLNVQIWLLGYCLVQTFKLHEAISMMSSWDGKLCWDVWFMQWPRTFCMRSFIVGSTMESVVLVEVWLKCCLQPDGIFLHQAPFRRVSHNPYANYGTFKIAKISR